MLYVGGTKYKTAWSRVIFLEDNICSVTRENSIVFGTLMLINFQ
jgi:hypothetical protein